MVTLTCMICHSAACSGGCRSSQGSQPDAKAVECGCSGDGCADCNGNSRVHGLEFGVILILQTARVFPPRSFGTPVVGCSCGGDGCGDCNGASNAVLAGKVGD